MGAAGEERSGRGEPGFLRAGGGGWLRGRGGGRGRGSWLRRGRGDLRRVGFPVVGSLLWFGLGWPRLKKINKIKLGVC